MIVISIFYDTLKTLHFMTISMTCDSLKFNMGSLNTSLWEFTGNKAKGRISKRVFQENKARQIFRKENIHTCAYHGVKNVRFSEILACFVFLKHPFWDSTLLPTISAIQIF